MKVSYEVHENTNDKYVLTVVHILSPPLFYSCKVETNAEFHVPGKPSNEVQLARVQAHLIADDIQSASRVISVMSPSRYIVNDNKLVSEVVDQHAELITSLTSILDGYPPTQPFFHRNSGLYSGPTSIAYLFLWVTHIQDNILIYNTPAIEWCRSYLDCSNRSLTHQASSSGSCSGSRPRAGIIDPCCSYHAIFASATQSTQSINVLLEAVHGMHQSEPAANNELLYGRAGTLALLRIVRHFVPSATAIINAAMSPLIDHIMANQPWTWHSKEYIGAAHGDIGIITQIISCDPSYAPSLESNLRSLLSLQTAEGHWDPHPTANPDKVQSLGQICHGTPGFVVSLVKLLPHFPTMRTLIESAIQRGREYIWQKGLLRKEPNLCHGIVGNALALAMGERRNHFLAFCKRDVIQELTTEGVFKEGEDRWGLWCGEGGRAWGWIVHDAGMEGAIPGYTDV